MEPKNDWSKLLREHMNKPVTIYKVQYKLNKDQLQDFVNGLHDIQEQMIEEAVERSGYKDAKEILAHIMAK